MTFERSWCSVKKVWCGHLLIISIISAHAHALYLHSSRWKKVAWLKTQFSWKIGRRLYLLLHHNSVTWPDPDNFVLPKVAKRMPECHISYGQFQRDPTSSSVTISEKKLMGNASPPPPSTAQWCKLRCNMKIKWLVVTPFPGLRPSLTNLKSDHFGIFWRQVRPGQRVMASLYKV